MMWWSLLGLGWQVGWCLRLTLCLRLPSMELMAWGTSWCRHACISGRLVGTRQQSK